MRIQRGDRGSGPPMKNHKNIGSLSNSGPDPLKITKLPSQHSMLGHHKRASETPFNVSTMARLLWYLDLPTPSSTQQKNVKVGPPLTKCSRSALATKYTMHQQHQYHRSLTHWLKCILLAPNIRPSFCCC